MIRVQGTFFESTKGAGARLVDCDRIVVFQHSATVLFVVYENGKTASIQKAVV
jgi:hypothetical protein